MLHIYVNELPILRANELLLEAQTAIVGNSSSYSTHTVRSIMRDLQTESDRNARRRAPVASREQLQMIGIQVKAASDG